MRNVVANDSTRKPCRQLGAALAVHSLHKSHDDDTGSMASFCILHGQAASHLGVGGHRVGKSHNEQSSESVTRPHDVAQSGGTRRRVRKTGGTSKKYEE